MEVVGGAASEAEHQIFGRRRRRRRRRLGGGKHLRDRRIRHAREEREESEGANQHRTAGLAPPSSEHCGLEALVGFIIICSQETKSIASFYGP